MTPSFFRPLLVAAAVALACIAPAGAQSSSAQLGEALAAALERPLTPPEAWAVQQTVRGHLAEVREARAAFAARVGAATGLAAERIVALLPPLGRGTLSADRDPRPALVADLGRPLDPEEEAAVAAAEDTLAVALAPHRAALADRLATLTDLAPERILPELPRLGL